MTTFYVGQRVRIKYSNGWPELAGEEGVVEGPSPTAGACGGSQYVVAPRCWGTSVAPKPGRRGTIQFWPNARQLEPILYDGNKTVEWSECLWQPNRQGAQA